MWTEHVDDTNLDCRLWPRGGAVAGSLWGLDESSQSTLTPRAPGGISDRDLRYAAASGKTLIQGYVRLRYFLASRGVRASELTFHDVLEDGAVSVRKYVPVSFPSELDVCRYVDNQNTLPISAHKRFDIGSIHLTSQCGVIDKDVFRPLREGELSHRRNSGEGGVGEEYDVFKAVQINAADGFPGDRQELMRAWLKSKANEGVDIVGEWLPRDDC